MKDLVLKKKSELEEHRRRAHLVGEEGYSDEFNIEAIESGAIDPALVLEQIEAHIATVKDEAFSRKDILEKVERFLNACEEEAWLEDYNKDDNRYNAGRGAHLTLKRAEKARILVNKIPGMVDLLTTKIIAWENERGKEFTYDGVRLLSMLDEYMIVRQEKEHEKKRQRDQKKLQDQLKAEQEALYGSKPSPSKPQSTKMGGVNRRMSMGGGATMQVPKTDILPSKNVRAAKRTEDIAHLSPGSRGLDIGDLPIKKLSFNASALREMETPRKPFAQIMPPPSSVSSTPVRPDTNFTDTENRTPNPKMFGALNPKTPMTVAAPMQLAMTPAVANQVTAAPVSLVYEKPEPTLPEEIEYSFEERRLAFYLSREIA